MDTGAENTWCKGCGNFGLMLAFKKAAEKISNLVMTCGIGCHGKMFDYVSVSGFYSLHGRSVATAQGMKIGNPSLNVIDFVGDGDSLAEGIAHLIHAAKRNADVTVVMHNNGIFALTTGQCSPTGEIGFISPTTPHGNQNEPFNPLTLMLECGATFVARGYTTEVEHLASLIAAGVAHKGFSFIEVLQPSVVFNNTYQKYNQIVSKLESPAGSFEEAVKLAKDTEKKLIGVLYQREATPHHERLVPVSEKNRDKRLELIKILLDEKR